jgi:hypothetical protein
LLGDGLLRFGFAEAGRRSAPATSDPLLGDAYQ